MANPEIKIEKDGNRVFVSAHGMIVDVMVTEEAIHVEVTRGNDVIADCYADAE